MAARRLGDGDEWGVGAARAWSSVATRAADVEAAAATGTNNNNNDDAEGAGFEEVDGEDSVATSALAPHIERRASLATSALAPSCPASLSASALPCQSRDECPAELSPSVLAVCSQGGARGAGSTSGVELVVQGTRAESGATAQGRVLARRVRAVHVAVHSCGEWSELRAEYLRGECERYTWLCSCALSRHSTCVT